MSVACRVAAECPLCHAPLILRRNRRTREPFLGCSRYPRCDFTEPFISALQGLVTQYAPMTEPLSRQDLDRELRRLISLVHPDKWHGAEVAHSITQEIVALRDRLKRGAER